MLGEQTKKRPRAEPEATYRYRKPKRPKHFTKAFVDGMAESAGADCRPLSKDEKTSRAFEEVDLLNAFLGVHDLRETESPTSPSPSPTAVFVTSKAKIERIPEPTVTLRVQCSFCGALRCNWIRWLPVSALQPRQWPMNRIECYIQFQIIIQC